MKKRIVALLLLLVLLLPAAMASAATYYRVNTSSLKVRYLPSTSAAVLGSYRKDYVATVQSVSGDWSYVVFTNGFEGYVETKYLKKAGSSYSAWISRDDTALRRGPDGSFGTTAMLMKGRKVTVLSHGDNYDYVSAGSLGSGYVVNSLLSKKKVKASGKTSYSTKISGGDYYAYVINAGGRKVNLRTFASTTAPVIAQYSTGTQVWVISHGSTWDKVTVDGNTGYMMTQYLTKSVPAPTNTPKPSAKPIGDYTAYVVSANKKGVNARRGAGDYATAYKVPYGAAVYVIKHNTKWDYIEYDGKKAYMNNKYLQLEKPKDAPTPTPVPTVTVKPVFVPYQAEVTSPNGKAVNVHKKPGLWSSNVDGIGRLDVGTVVTVLGVSKGWAEIEYNGLTGYMLREYLHKIK